MRPYFGLRSYQDDGQHYAGQIGSEPTPAEFVDALIAATREMVRVLKPSGSIFVNLGDKYAGSQPGSYRRDTQPFDHQLGDRSHRLTAEGQRGITDVEWGSVRPKSLMGIPWRYALRCIDDLGLTLRAEIIWNKPNGLPESVTDRVRRSHESWFHMVKQPRYFSAVDEIREEHAPSSISRAAYGVVDTHGPNRSRYDRDGEHNRVVRAPNSVGKLPGSVWTIPTQPLTVPPELGVDHFAAFPMEWPRRIIQGWSPAGVCTVCGEGRRPAKATLPDHANSTRKVPPDYLDSATLTRQNRNGRGSATFGFSTVTTITGYACACPAPQIPVTFTEFDFELDEMVTRTEMRPDPTWVNPAPTTPAVILDPFSGTGTTVLVAKMLGRTGIGVDMSSDYCRLAKWRCNDPGQMAAALQVEKPEPVSEGQPSLFEEVHALPP